MDNNFGLCIQSARRSKGYNQRKLAALVKVDHTYLSKLENGRADYPPKQDVIESLSQHLELDAEELSYLAGRISPEDARIIQDLARTYKKQMPVLLRKIRDNPEIVGEILGQRK